MNGQVILGMGQSGLSVARFLRGQGAGFHCYDDRPVERWSTDAQAFAGCSVRSLPQGTVQLIVSPGFPAEHTVIQQALSQGIEVVSEIEFAFRHAKGTIIGVTGSNGKSTTVSMIHHVLVNSGLPAILCGNIGQSFTSSLVAEEAIYVVEISSFQLEWIVTFRAHIGVLINVTADHLDRHHSMAGYEAAKLRLFENQLESDLAIVDAPFATRIPGDGEIEVVPSGHLVIHDDYIDLGKLGRLSLANFSLLGAHNRMNLLFTALAVSRLGITVNQIEEALSSFSGLQNRLETIGTCDGRLWINDSKATNPASTQVAIEAMTSPYVLILGGSDKDTNFGQLNLNANPPKAIVAYGETGPKAQSQLSNWPIEVVCDFDSACRHAHDLAGTGEAVLLAPACASFDQFDNYMARGEAFRSLFANCVGVS